MLSLQVYHPNIDLEGNVCLNILREDWKPVLSINSIIYGLQYLFLVSGLSAVNLLKDIDHYTPKEILISNLCVFMYGLNFEQQFVHNLS